jgi:hypothetical protein
VTAVLAEAVLVLVLVAVVLVVVEVLAAAIREAAVPKAAVLLKAAPTARTLVCCRCSSILARSGSSGVRATAGAGTPACTSALRRVEPRPP